MSSHPGATAVARLQYQITEGNLDAVLKSTKFEHLPGCNGKLRHFLRKRGVKTAFDMQNVPLEDLTNELGRKLGAMAWRYCRGIDAAPVQDRGPPK